MVNLMLDDLGRPAGEIPDVGLHLTIRHCTLMVRCRLARRCPCSDRQPSSARYSPLR